MEKSGCKKDVSVGVVKCEKKTVAEKDVAGDVILVDDSIKQEKASLDHLSKLLELIVDTGGIKI